MDIEHAQQSHDDNGDGQSQKLAAITCSTNKQIEIKGGGTVRYKPSKDINSVKIKITSKVKGTVRGEQSKSGIMYLVCGPLHTQGFLVSLKNTAF